MRPGRILAAVVLVAAALLAGFGLAQLAAPADTGARSQISGASTQVHDSGVRMVAPAPVRHVGDAGP